MPELSQSRIDYHILDVAESFTAEETYQGVEYELNGPHLIMAYSEPLRGVEQGALFTFNCGNAPEVILNIEKIGEELLLQISRLTPEKWCLNTKASSSRIWKTTVSEICSACVPGSYPSGSLNLSR